MGATASLKILEGTKCTLPRSSRRNDIPLRPGEKIIYVENEKDPTREPINALYNI